MIVLPKLYREGKRNSPFCVAENNFRGYFFASNVHSAMSVFDNMERRKKRYINRSNHVALNQEITETVEEESGKSIRFSIIC